MPAKAKDTPVTALSPNARNPRRITTEQTEKLDAALKKFGDLGGIVNNRRSGTLIGGHQRVSTFRDDPEATVHITDKLAEPDSTGTVAFGYVIANGTRYAYREVEWDEQTQNAAMIAANAHGGDWDDTALASLIRELDSTEFLGFDDEELKRLMPDPASPPTDFPIHDENIPVQHKCPKCGYQWSGKPS